MGMQVVPQTLKPEAVGQLHTPAPEQRKLAPQDVLGLLMHIPAEQVPVPSV